jgi:hypothetical protein
MEEEYGAFLANQTWDLMPRPSGCNVVTGKWIVGAKSDTSLFIYHHADGVAYLLLYIDDIILTASSP